MTVEQARKTWNTKLDYYRQRIEEKFEDARIWIDQAYGYTQALNDTVDGFYEEVSSEEWITWYMSVHPAYNKEEI